MTTTDATTPALADAAPTVNLATEASTGLVEILLVGAVVAVALVYLWRSYFGRRRPACASCGKAKACPAATNAGAVTPE
ncbi:hypothetical protein [uncultured Rhodospira sp.]|uniref:hypothetical protein n=1 Tax=uncultured Rhodospira sp. TaxID=1936189 RepID=UPI002605C940|nr:hypothetical protein [uncultured Rhodospira sp.]